MRKILFSLFLFLIVAYNPQVILAKSGCCSWHGGVSGCDSNTGRQICNDGTLSPSCTCSYPPPIPTDTPFYQTFTSVPTAIPTQIPTSTPTITFTPPPTQIPTLEPTYKIIDNDISLTPMMKGTTESNPISGIFSSLVLGGSGYWIYKKFKDKNK